MVTQTVTTGAGVRKVIIAVNPADLGAAVTVAKSETLPKTPDINDKTYANKRQKDL